MLSSRFLPAQLLRVLALVLSTGNTTHIRIRVIIEVLANAKHASAPTAPEARIPALKGCESYDKRSSQRPKPSPSITLASITAVEHGYLRVGLIIFQSSCISTPIQRLQIAAESHNPRSVLHVVKGKFA